MTICSVNQCTDFYMIGNFVMKELIPVFFCFFFSCHICGQSKSLLCISLLETGAIELEFTINYFVTEHSTDRPNDWTVLWKLICMVHWLKPNSSDRLFEGFLRKGFMTKNMIWRERQWEDGKTFSKGD